MEICESGEVFIDFLSVQAIWYLTIERISIDTIPAGIAASAMGFIDSRPQIMAAVDAFGLVQAAMHMAANKVIVDIIISVDMVDELVVEMMVDRVVDKLVGMVVDNNADYKVAA